MKHRPRHPEQDGLRRPRLVDMINHRHELVKLAGLTDQAVFERSEGSQNRPGDGFARRRAGFFASGKGRPATEPRLVAGLLYLQRAYRLSDAAVVARWVENPCDQHLTGKTFIQRKLPIHPASLTRWRGRIGEEGVASDPEDPGRAGPGRSPVPSTTAASSVWRWIPPSWKRKSPISQMPDFMSGRVNRW